MFGCSASFLPRGDLFEIFIALLPGDSYGIPRMKSKSLFVLLLLFPVLLLFQGCATTYVNPSTDTNPPPSEAFSSFHRFEMTPISMGEPYAGQSANESAVKKIQENLDLRLASVLNSWNATGGDNGRTLLIQPEIQDIKFVSGGARFMAGALAGSSAVVMKVKFIDQETGAIIAYPEFYQRAAAMGGAYTLGGTDNNMLIRIANLASDYTVSNYAQAVGGPTGAGK